MNRCDNLQYSAFGQLLLANPDLFTVYAIPDSKNSIRIANIVYLHNWPRQSCFYRLTFCKILNYYIGHESQCHEIFYLWFVIERAGNTWAQQHQTKDYILVLIYNDEINYSYVEIIDALDL